MRPVSAQLPRPPGGGTSHPDHLELNLDLAGVLELQGASGLLPRSQRMQKAHKHDVTSARLRFDRAARRKVNALQLPHSHHAVLDHHIVNFEARRRLHRSAEKAVRHVPTVFDDEIACTDLRSPRGRSRPRVRDHDVAGLELLPRGDPCCSQQGAGKRDVRELRSHWSCFTHKQFWVAIRRTIGWMRKLLQPETIFSHQIPSLAPAGEDARTAV